MPESTSSSPDKRLLVGLMSGTSLDGVDGVLATFCSNSVDGMPARMLAHAHVPFSDDLRRDLMLLQTPGHNEINREAQLANLLARRYADCVSLLLRDTGIEAVAVQAIGVHGQTIRHRPELGYTRQTNNPALLAEMTGIDVIADFRSRDIAAAGQGAPLVPAFHRAAFGADGECRVVANIGGIANITVLNADREDIAGFDTGPGNVLMDLWTSRQRNQAFDAGGAWAASGSVIPELLRRLSSDPYFTRLPPKSTGRDLFNAEWLGAHLDAFGSALRPEDVQRTLCELTAITLADAIRGSAANARAVYVCGGGACNDFLMQRIQAALRQAGMRTQVETTEMLGIATGHVEALAFAWLAGQFIARRPGNLPVVTGAKGSRVLGALYPA